MAAFLRKYGAATHVRIPIVKRAVVDFAVGADWTPAAGDVKISKDGGAAANVTNLPTATAMGNTAYWDFSLTATELQAASLIVTVADSATKVVEDQAFIINTYGNASAQILADFDDTVRQGMTALPNVAAGADGGLPVAGATQTLNLQKLNIVNNAGDAIVASSTGSNGNGINASGNGTADGIKATGGATGRGLHAVGGATSGAGIRAEGTAGNSIGLHAVGQGSGAGYESDGGATGPAEKYVGGATSGAGVSITTTSGDGISVAPTAGHGMNLAANGTSKHGLLATGGTAGTSDGIKGAAGTGGVDIRGNITGNVTGNVSGSVGSLTTNNDKIGYSLADSPGFKKNTAFNNFEFVMRLTSDHFTAAPGKTVSGTRSIDGGTPAATTNSVTEVTSGQGLYKINLSAADLNGDSISFRFSAATCDDTFLTIVTEA